MSEHRGIVERWLDRTEKALLGEMRRMNVHESGRLRQGIGTGAYERGGVIVGEIAFPVYGRFVDMGAGRGARIGALSGRTPKKWYSPTVYRRLNILQGALGIQIMEDSLKVVKDAIEDGTKH